MWFSNSSYQEAESISSHFESGLGQWLALPNGTLSNIIQADSLKELPYCTLSSCAVFRTLSLLCEQNWAKLMEDERLNAGKASTTIWQLPEQVKSSWIIQPSTLLEGPENASWVGPDKNSTVVSKIDKLLFWAIKLIFFLSSLFSPLLSLHCLSFSYLLHFFLCCYNL